MDLKDVASFAGPVGNLIGQGINAINTGKTNQRDRQHQEYMYWLQRNNDVADWDKQNAYNSPQEQMKRLQQAGINPNLVYGSGSATGGTASPVHSTGTSSWRSETPKFDFGTPIQQGMQSYFDVQMKNATLDNLKAQNTAIINEAALKEAQTRSVEASIPLRQFDLDYRTEARPYSLQQLQQTARKTGIEADNAISENERRAAQNSLSLQEGAERILNMRQQRATGTVERERIRQQIENLKNNSVLQQLDIKLRNLGVQPNDSIFTRSIAKALDGTLSIDDLKPTNVIKGAKKAYETISDWWKK